MPCASIFGSTRCRRRCSEDSQIGRLGSMTSRGVDDGVAAFVWANRRACTTSRTGLPAMGRSARRGRYLLWTRVQIDPHSGQALVLFTARTVISRPAASQVASSTAKPRGTRADGWRASRMVLIPLVKPTSAGSPIPIKIESDGVFGRPALRLEGLGRVLRFWLMVTVVWP